MDIIRFLFVFLLLAVSTSKAGHGGGQSAGQGSFASPEIPSEEDPLPPPPEMPTSDPQSDDDMKPEDENSNDELPPPPPPPEIPTWDPNPEMDPKPEDGNSNDEYPLPPPEMPTSDPKPEEDPKPEDEDSNDELPPPPPPPEIPTSDPNPEKDPKPEDENSNDEYPLPPPEMPTSDPKPENDPKPEDEDSNDEYPLPSPDMPIPDPNPEMPPKPEDENSCDDICHLSKKPGPCMGSFPRWFFNSATNECESFIYGGCGGNDNRFETEAECEKECKPKIKDICSLEKKPGKCEGYFPSWYFNSATQQCEQFIYGGCGGNDNRFASQEECEKKCPPKIKDICFLKYEPGLCDGYFPRWYYNPSSQQCETFIYGGCGGNANRFESQEECEKKCAPKVKGPCDQPLDPGPCKGSMTRWYYNQLTGTCMKFTYGGCLGNDNNFLSEEDCHETCFDKHFDICQLPKVVGPCEALIPRFYFDYDEKMCVPFSYGGCEGNANNFETVDDCLDACCLPN